MAENTQKNKTKPLKKADPAALLSWYDRHRRVMPWRAPADRRADPYHVWLSEIMLQQTTVAAVGPYFLKFVQRWPRLPDLAAATQDELFQMWAGLGYYRRARGLYECAQVLMRDYGGRFPQSEAELLKLPGIGPYTAAAIVAIAFDQRANVVDGNVERVMARLHAVREPLPQSKKKLKELAAQNLPDRRFGDYAQALMDLGATICTPRSPKCAVCPWCSDCQAQKLVIAEKLPVRTKTRTKPQRYAIAFALFDTKGRVYLRQRPPEGLLASMMEVPSSPWEDGKGLALEQALRYAPSKAAWRLLSGEVRHSFTHFDLTVRVAVARGTTRANGEWAIPVDLTTLALPSLMRKIIAYADRLINEDNT